MDYVYTKNAPDAIGPYSQAVKANGLVFTSGQIAINPATGAVEADTIEAQTEQVCNNLKNVLEAAGSSLDKAVKIAIGTAKKFVEDNPGRLDEIKWVLFDDNTLKAYQNELDEWSDSDERVRVMGIRV